MLVMRWLFMAVMMSPPKVMDELKIVFWVLPPCNPFCAEAFKVTEFLVKVRICY